MIVYPTAEEIMSVNKRVLRYHRETKAERYGLVKPKASIQRIIDRAKRTRGDVIRKAAVLLKGLNRAHPFESANKRTSTFVAFNFIWNNLYYVPLRKKTKKNIEFIYGVREGRYDVKEVEKWLRR